MECIKHIGTQAAGTCTSCGAGLCSSCFSRFEAPICEKCLIKHNDNIERKSYIEIGITIAIFIVCFIMYIFSKNGTIDSTITLAILITGAYWGRSVLTQNSLPSGVLVNMKTYGFMSIINFIIAIFFGVLITPFAIYKRIREVMKVKQTRKDIAAGNI